MPKQKITKEMIVEAAFELARRGGMEQLLVKNIAEKLGCSVQPIYSYCSNMEGLRREVFARNDLFMREFLAAHIDRNDFFRSTGRAYAQLAKEEPHIFQMFLLHKREGITSLDDLYRQETDPRIAGFLAESLGIDLPAAQALHLNMLIYNVGISTILATAEPGIPMEEISAQTENAYRIFLERTLKQKEEESE